MASFSQRESGWWQARIRLRGMTPISRTFPNRRLAEDWAKVTESDVLRGVFVSRNDADRILFRDVAQRYVSEVLPTKRSGGRDEYKVRRLIQSFGNLTLALVTPASLASYRDVRLREGVSPQTVVHELGLVSRILKAAVLDWGIQLPAGLPTTQVRKPRISNSRERRLLPREEELLIASCERSRLSGLSSVVILALETAARQGELLSLDWQDVNLRTGVARLRGEGGGITKSGANFREVPLSPRALQILRRQQGRVTRVKGTVFGLTANSLKKAWTAAVRRARLDYLQGELWSRLLMKVLDEEVLKKEIHKILRRGGRVSTTPPLPVTQRVAKELNDDPMFVDLRFHDLRHEATSRLAETFQLHELMKITGHSDSRMLARYYHPRAADLAKRLRDSSINS